jgi:hypothetical protein
MTGTRGRLRRQLDRVTLVLAVVHQEEQVLQPVLKGAKQDLSVVTSYAHDRDTIVMA